MATRWDDTQAPKGDDYDERWQHLAATGQNIHGEADLVETLLHDHGGQRVLDAGCGTGRVALELRRRGFAVVGVDADDTMLATARRNGPDVAWVLADLTTLDHHVDSEFDLALLAGNVMIFVDPGTEDAVLAQLAERLTPGGLLVAGFSLRDDRLTLADYDRLAARNGFDLHARWSTWDREPFDADSADYAVSVHRRR
ncbi:MULTISPECIES: class I SAM-dependent DNA methyltransferase [Gordonia]|uniref:Class I SAM-dependent methyltransferase n=1 Tax=Gordonia tangerina TaxID=2911060 RepID=A0ABS9DLJ2_9ACTN|nr:class I SAM-dependent methyltransferase [Gordonia tangerina]MCF3939444.1 class I SAM-dependent methyltransferase [Gordonia tangerina]